ncbi:hypothetical protein L1N85_13665 [Paenibacillus alkaliterrae]|uniref:hypothetical protein n=1 Tax=Paenibacillus alkaliterrae TaxID=320909 RepID=UPI001F4396A3|nr:hypothetical protein [Paenibacillus alkaliterrae]MCF2939467.1 hypothetical protein [Paenibacillus alkaliterrae]
MEQDRKIELVEQYLYEIKSVIATMTMMKQMSQEQIAKLKEPLNTGKIESRMSTLQFGLDYYTFLNEWYEKYLTQLKNE